MKNLFKSLIVFIIFMTSLNTCYARDLNKKYISESTTIVNHVYDSVTVENKQYNLANKYYGQARNLQELKSLVMLAMNQRQENISIKFTGYECYNSSSSINLNVIQDAIGDMLNEDHYLKYSLKGYSIGASGYYGDLNLTLRVQYLTTKSQEEYVDRRVYE